MASPHAYRHLLGRMMAEDTAADSGGGYVAPSPAPAPVTAASSAPATTVTPRAFDVVYTYGDGVIYDLWTRSPAQVASNAGLMPNGTEGATPNGYTYIYGYGGSVADGLFDPIMSQRMMNAFAQVPQIRDANNRGMMLYPLLYVRTDAMNAYRPTSYEYMAPVVSYVGAPPAPTPAPSDPWAGRQQHTDRPNMIPSAPSPAPLVSAPAPTQAPVAAPTPTPAPLIAPLSPSAGNPWAGTQNPWGSDDGAVTSGPGATPSQPAATSNSGLLILAALAAIALSQ